MPTRFAYGFDDVLTDDHGELGAVRLGEAGAYATVHAGGLSYDVMRRGKRGWHFTLMTVSGATLCEFRPFRLREGGRLLGPAMNVSLKHRLWSADWTIDGVGQTRLTASHALLRRSKSPRGQGPLAAVLRATGMPAKLYLTAPTALVQTRETIPILTFACWLIVQWEGISGGAALGAGGP